MKHLSDYTATGRSRGHELSILNDVARSLNASVDLSAILESTLQRVAELLGLKTGWILLFDEVTGQPYPAAALNLPPGLSRDAKRMEGWCYCLESYCSGDLSSAENIGVVACSRLRRLALAHGETAGLRHHASVPLRVSDASSERSGRSRCAKESGFRHLGILNVASPEWRQLSEEELDLLHTIGDMLGVAIERARLHAHRLEAAQTEERNRLAREIHDTIAQDLSAIVFQLEASEALLQSQSQPEVLRNSLSNALQLARKSLDETRRSVLDLRPAPLEGRTLSEAITALAEQAREQYGVKVIFTPIAAPDSVAPAVEVGLFRVAREALQNALRHADAEHVNLRLSGSSDGLRLVIEDDGKGFEVDGVGTDGLAERFGLVGMRERVRLLGGDLRIESTPGLGTRITADVPTADRASSLKYLP